MGTRVVGRACTPAQIDQRCVAKPGDDRSLQIRVLLERTDFCFSNGLQLEMIRTHSRA
jgi:hypothetical protein